MEEKTFEYFLTIAEEKNISRAARRLYISQPTLSKYLIGLETELGVQLFRRNRGELEITEAGQIYQTYAHQFLDLAAQLKKDLAAAEGRKQETISLGITPWISSYVAFQIMNTFSVSHPRVSLNIVEDFGQNLFSQFLDGKLDLVLSNITRPVRAKLPETDGWIPVLPDRLLVVVPRQISAEFGLQPGSTDFSHPGLLPVLPFKGCSIITGKPHQHLHTIIGDIVDFYNLKPSAVIESQNTDNCLNLSDAGHGISFIPEIYVQNRPPLRNSDVYIVESPKFDYTRVVFFHKDKKTPAQEDLIRMIQKVCREIRVRKS